MKDTFPDLHENLMQHTNSVNLYETFIANGVRIEVKACFLRLARRCFRINNRLKAKALNIETLLCRKYSDRMMGRLCPEQDQADKEDSYSDMEKTLFQIVLEVEKRCGMGGHS